jgi:hypothetical protein
MTDEKEHPFNHRSEDMKRALFLLTDEGPASWEAIFITGRTLGYSDKTMRNAINEGVNLGVFEKSGGKAGRKAGRPTGPPMIHLTEGGRRWFEVKLKPDYPDDIACTYCGDVPTRVLAQGDAVERACRLCDGDDVTMTEEEELAHLERLTQQYSGQ